MLSQNSLSRSIGKLSLSNNKTRSSLEISSIDTKLTSPRMVQIGPLNRFELMKAYSESSSFLRSSSAVRSSTLHSRVSLARSIEFFWASMVAIAVRRSSCMKTTVHKSAMLQTKSLSSIDHFRIRLFSKK